MTAGTDPVHKVTIIPRGRALGLTAQLPEDDRYNFSRDYMEGMLAILMGGRVAEEVVLNQMTTGAGNDIERATSLARKMVTEWGMSEKMGPMTYGQKKEEIFIGRDLGMHRDFSEDMAKKIDAEVRKIIDTAYKKARDIISKNQDKLEKITNLLLDKESIDGRQLDRILGMKHEGSSQVKKNENPQRGRNRSNNPRQRSENPRQKQEKVTPKGENKPATPAEIVAPKTEDKPVATDESVDPKVASKPAIVTEPAIPEKEAEVKDTPKKAEEKVKKPVPVKKKAPVRRRPAKSKKATESEGSAESTQKEPEEPKE